MAPHQTVRPSAWRRWLSRLRSWWVKVVNGGKTAQPLTPVAPVTSAPQGRQPSRKGQPARSDRLVLGPVVRSGTGGQGSVYTIAHDPGLVYKQYHTPIAGAVGSFYKLVQAGELVDRIHGDVDFLWPKALFGSGDQVAGYTMQLLPAEYTMTMTTPYGTRSVLGHLMVALPRGGPFRLTHEPSEHDRLALAVLIAKGLATLHAHNVTYRDISLLNIVFGMDPLRIGFLDMDSARVISEPITSEKDGMDTPDWFDPLGSGKPPIGFDLDRYKFALLAYRLLVTHIPSSPLTKAGVDSIGQVDGIQSQNIPDVKRLLSRALGPAGTRPPASEWQAVLATGAQRT